MGRSKAEAAFKHGHAKDGEWSGAYKSWVAMKSRCKSHPHYKRLGIVVCDRWVEFRNFLADMGERPDGGTLDRIDGAKGYSPENCRWSTRKQQSSNIKTNLYIEYMGERKTLSEWSRCTGIPVETIRCRYKTGRRIEEVFSKTKCERRA